MLPKGYTFLDPEENDEAADKLADRYIRVGSDKELEAVIGTDDDRPEVVAALFTAYTKDAFSFDVVVRHDHRRKGLARALVHIAVDQYDSVKDAFDKDFHMEVDVINPDMERLLKSMGFEVDERLGKDHVQMTKESAIMQAIREMTQTQKKQAKKKFRRKQAFQAGSQAVSKQGVPSFEDVWEEVKNSDSVNNILEHLAWDKGQQSQFEYETDKDPEEHPEEFQEWLLENAVKEEVENRYEDVIYFINHEMDGEDCWRAVGLTKNVDPVKHEDLGVYWSSKEEGADEYWGNRSGTRSCTYRARIDRRNVDLAGTVYARMDMSLGEEESEVRMIPGAKIFVYDVEVCDSRMMSGKCRTLEINDWRHA